MNNTRKEMSHTDNILDNYNDRDISDIDDANDKIVLSDVVKKISRRALNTTSSVYKIRDPNIQQLLFCICAVIQSQIIADLDEPCDGKNLIFDRSEYTVEYIHPNILAFESGDNEELMQQMISGVVPSLSGMYDFLYAIKRVSPLFSTECHIISLIYLNRLTNMGSIKVTSRNWQKIWLSSFILAQKVWYDKPMRTSFFANLIPSVDKNILRELESNVLHILDFNTNVKRGLYATYYFDLRHLHLIGSSDDNKEWSIKPLSICQAERLELSSKSPKMSTTDKVRQSSRLVIVADKMPTIETKSNVPKKEHGDNPIVPSKSVVSELPAISNNQRDDDDDIRPSPSLHSISITRGNSLKSEKDSNLNKILSNKTYEDVTTLQERSRYVIPL